MAKKIETKIEETPVELIFNGAEWVNSDAPVFDFENNIFDGTSWIPKTIDEVNG
jgi:hypothetical protein